MEQQRTYESLPVCIYCLLTLGSIGGSCLQSQGQTCHCLSHAAAMPRFIQSLFGSQTDPVPVYDPSFAPCCSALTCGMLSSTGEPCRWGVCFCVRRPLSPGPCVVWLYVYVCGLPGPLLICPRPANGLPSDHGCLLYFCLHQLNSDRPLPPAGPNQAPAPPLSSLWRGPRVWDKTGQWVLVD